MKDYKDLQRAIEFFAEFEKAHEPTAIQKLDAIRDCVMSGILLGIASFLAIMLM